MSPQTDAEAHREAARLVLRPWHLLQGYVGDVEIARRDITSSVAGFGGPGYSVQVDGHHVVYAFASGPNGRVRIADLLRLAARTASRSAVERLTAAWSARGDALHRRPGAPSQADAEAEVAAAAQAWWAAPEPTPTQLDLFATTEGPQ